MGHQVIDNGSQGCGLGPASGLQGSLQEEGSWTLVLTKVQAPSLLSSLNFLSSFQIALKKEVRCSS
jgi:hypothetical protein